MYKLFLFVAFLAFAAAAPGGLNPLLSYATPALYNPSFAVPYPYSGYSTPFAYNYNSFAPYPYKGAYLDI